MYVPTYTEEVIEKQNNVFGNNDKIKILYPTKIFESLDEIFNTEFWLRIKENYYAPDVNSIEKIYREFSFIAGYEIDNNIYIHCINNEGERLFNKLDIHTILDNGGLNTVEILPNGSIVYTKVHGENAKHNRDVWKQRGQTITKVYF